MINYKHNILALLLGLFLLSIYQTPQIINFLYQHNIIIDLENLNYGKTLQTKVENIKLDIYNMFNSSETQPKTSSITNADSNNIIPTPQKMEAAITSNGKCIDSCKVLVIGDSLMGDVFFSLNRKSKENKILKVVDGHKVSSGLSNSNFYDWVEVSETLIKKNKPDYVIALLGTNDAQSILYNKKSYAFNTDKWKESYAEKIKSIKTVSKNENTELFWIELPQVRSDEFNKKLDNIRNIQKQEMQENLIETNIELGTKDNPDFMKFRQHDGIHLNAKGSDIIAIKLLNKILPMSFH